MTHVKTHDSFFGSAIPHGENLIYRADLSDYKPLPFAYFLPDTHFVVGFVMDLRKTFIERSVYNIFDFTKDVGGLVSGLHGLFVILVTIIQFQDLHFFMVT